MEERRERRKAQEINSLFPKFTGIKVSKRHFKQKITLSFHLGTFYSSFAFFYACTENLILFYDYVEKFYGSGTLCEFDERLAQSGGKFGAE
jgi:hypothetical protein